MSRAKAWHLRCLAYTPQMYYKELGSSDCGTFFGGPNSIVNKEGEVAEWGDKIRDEVGLPSTRRLLQVWG